MYKKSGIQKVSVDKGLHLSITLNIDEASKSLTTINMMTSSNGDISELLALCAGNSPVTGEFHAQRPVTRSFDPRLNKQLS